MSLTVSVWLLAVAVTVVIGSWEWRRVDPARRGLRMAAIGLAGAALALLGLRPGVSGDTADGVSESVTLVTDGAGSIPPTSGPVVDIGDAPSGDRSRSLVPDAAFLRRSRPGVNEFKIAGSGVSAADAVALAGQRVTRVGSLVAPTEPRFDVLTVPREVTLGEPVRVQGRVTGLTPGAALSVALEAPDGTVRTVEVLAVSGGNGTFAVDGGVPVAMGDFVWRLRLGSRGEAVTLGVSVVQPNLPRILFWESAPSTESVRLRRWLGEIGATSAARVQVSTDRVRTTGTAVGDLQQLSAELLTDFDLLICDAASYAQLTGAELTALQVAVHDGALGLLVVTDESPMAERTEFPLPWTVAMDGTGAEGPDEVVRRTRLRLFDGTALEEPVAVANATIVAKAAGRGLAVDPLDRSVAMSFAHGRGQIAISLVQDSWRWRQQGQERAFARFWTALLSALVRPVPAAMPWAVLDADTPFFVDQPVRFAYVGPGEPPDMAPVMFTAEQARPTPLSYEKTGVAVAWPRAPGWHQLAADADGVRRAFYVQPPQALLAVQAEIRRRITDRLVVDSPAEPRAAAVAAGSRVGLQGIAFLLLMGALTGLWMEERWRKRG
ncbi:MAG TPA: hypothetical protein VGD88_14050 [Opitutaceae bacterium]